MTRILYKLAFWVLTLSWLGGCDKDGDSWDEGGGDLYGPLSYRIDCDDGYIPWDKHFGDCYKACETDEDCAEENQGANDDSSATDCTTIICNPDQGICWEGCETCFEDAHCEDGQTCEEQTCGSGEDSDPDGDSELEETEADGDEELEDDETR